ncbi:MAG: SRPBCC family protein [Bacteroidota bacterium]|nr:SRPBCC family protein [Bacteroidota bacterium]
MKLTHKINKSPGFVFGHLTDIQKFVSVHPVIYKMENLQENQYKVFETLKFGFIPYSFSYFATIDGDEKNQHVVMRATVMKINKIEMVFNLMEEEKYTIVEEEIIFKSPLPIKRMMQSIFRKQHMQLFENIGRVEGK